MQVLAVHYKCGDKRATDMTAPLTATDVWGACNRHVRQGKAEKQRPDNVKLDDIGKQYHYPHNNIVYGLQKIRVFRMNEGLGVGSGLSDAFAV